MSLLGKTRLCVALSPGGGDWVKARLSRPITRATPAFIFSPGAALTNFFNYPRVVTRGGEAAMSGGRLLAVLAEEEEEVEGKKNGEEEEVYE